MLYVIGIVNLLLGVFTFGYLFSEPKPVVGYLYAAMLGSIGLNILLFSLIRKGWENYSSHKKIFSIIICLFGDFELWFPILTTPYIWRLLWQ